MACACHGKQKKVVNTTKPEDQCTTCARKHVKQAWSAWGQFTYQETNRDYVSGQLRMAINHLKYDHSDVALQLRELALVIQENKQPNIRYVKAQLDRFLAITRNLFYRDNPQATQRLEALQNQYNNNQK